MDYAELSDLEEGEILEYESGSLSDSRCDDFEIKGCFRSLRKDHKSRNSQLKENQDRDLYMRERGKDGCLNKSLKNKWRFSEKLKDLKSNMGLVDLESISSEEEHGSDEENKYSDENEKPTVHGESRNGKKKQSSQLYGTVEDIMSEIGETICRKSRCNYKKRKSKECQHRLKKYSDKSYDIWRHKIFSSHLKNKKHKRSVSYTDSDSNSAKDRSEKRKKKKKRRKVCYKEERKSKKNSQVRDFDEMRQTLLEKLKKQKAEEESKALRNDCAPEMENSEIQEMDMLMDCTNYVDNPKDAVPEYSAGEGGIEEKEREDELDLIRLRLIALASNKKQRCGETPSKTVKTEELSEMKKSLDNSSDDLDRNELLLRAEALKTALLKKHQKRLNKLKVKKTEGANDTDVNSGVEGINCGHSEEVSANLDADSFKENLETESVSKEARSFTHDLNSEVNVNKLNEAPSDSSGSRKKIHSKPRTTRRKRKSGSFANNLKENSEKSEAFEEDDRTLRTQLLSDLMKKKSLKNVEEKSVLLESIQTSANKPPPLVISCQPPEENGKPLPVAKKTLVKKVNPPKTTKPVIGAAIPKAEIQRIIVHLGSEDSSDDDDDDDESPCQAPSGLGMEDKQEDEKDRKENAVMNLTDVNKAVHADYERSVELLLSQARKKIEKEKRVAEESALATPEAVYKHLPPSQRLEYIRLKQKIAERERLRKERADNSSTLAPVDSKPLETSTKETPRISQSFKSESENIIKAANKPVASSSSNSLVNKSLSKPVVDLHSPSSNKTIGLTNFNRLKTKEASQRRVLNKTKNNLETVRGKEPPPGKEPKSGVPIQRSRLLLPSSQALILKLKLLLKKIKIEKIIEENYEKEIVKLKSQLNLLEKKKNEQRFKIKKLGEESMKTYKAIQGITAKTNEKAAPKENEEVLKKKEGGDSESKDEKKPEEKAEGKKVLNEPEMELSKAQNETDKGLNNGDKTSEITREKSTGVCLLEYQSPLQVFNKASFCSERVDPNVMMCQFDLTGVCKDEECAYQHLRTLSVVGRINVAAQNYSETSTSSSASGFPEFFARNDFKGYN